MASPVNAALCAMLATAFWSLLGYALTRHLLPRALAIGAAPVTGWAVHSAATLPIFFLIGFSPLAVVAVAALCVAVSRRDAQARGGRRCRGHAGHTMVGVRSRRGAGAGAGGGDPAENVR